MNITFEQLRAESSVRVIMEHVKESQGDKSYDMVMKAIYEGWMEESVITAGFIFSFIMREAGAPAPIFTNPILELVFSVAQGSDEDYDSEEDWRRQRHAIVEEFLEWGEKFLAWGDQCQGAEPEFNWDYFTKALKEHGVISSSSMNKLDISVGVRRGVSAIHSAKRLNDMNLLRDSILHLLLRKNVLDDYRRFLSVLESALANRRSLVVTARSTFSPFLELSQEEKDTLLPLVRALYGHLSDYYSMRSSDPSKECSQVIDLVLEHGGSFTPENLLSFAALVQEYNWEWAMAAMEWDRARSD